MAGTVHEYRQAVRYRRESPIQKLHVSIAPLVWICLQRLLQLVETHLSTSPPIFHLLSHQNFRNIQDFGCHMQSLDKQPSPGKSLAAALCDSPCGTVLLFKVANRWGSDPTVIIHQTLIPFLPHLSYRAQIVVDFILRNSLKNIISCTRRQCNCI